MATADKLIKFLNAANVADLIDQEDRDEIAANVVVGYQIDEESRADWLETNKQAMKLIKTADKDTETTQRDFPFKDSAKVVYPLIGPAVIQLASRLIQHLTRNGRVAECSISGKDTPEMVQAPNQAPLQPGQPPQPPQMVPTGLGVKESKAKRISDFLSYEMLIESDTWLPDQHKLCHILAAWGMAFKEVYYDKVLETNCSEVLAPEDVIINHNITSLDRTNRITIRLYMTKNQIIERIRSGEFLDVDLDLMSSHMMDNLDRENDSRESQPVYEILKQYCYYDLDDDEYDEPYCVYVHNQSKTMLGIYPAFDLQDINISPKGEVKSIRMSHGIVDYKLIDDPEGKYYSLGLNHLLVHSSKSITSILRQLIDAGTLANAAASTGFVTRSLKTKDRQIRVKLGEFIPVDLPPDQRIADQFSNLPFREPSQVLLGLLELLIQNAKETGFMTDILTGDAETQNVPATTTLAMVEQGSRAFKPLVQKLYSSLKKEFKLWFKLHSKYLNKTKYFKFNDGDVQVEASDFDMSSMDVNPVADPTMSSEAHRYARLQALFQLMQSPVGQGLNMQAALHEYLSGLEFSNSDQLIAPPAPPPPPDPKMIEVQLKQQQAQSQHQLGVAKLQLQDKKLDHDETKLAIQAHLAGVKTTEMKAKTSKMIVDAHSDIMDTVDKQDRTNIEQFKAETDRMAVNRDNAEDRGTE